MCLMIPGMWHAHVDVLVVSQEDPSSHLSLVDDIPVSTHTSAVGVDLKQPNIVFILTWVLMTVPVLRSPAGFWSLHCRFSLGVEVVAMRQAGT
ncbi:hypothetical protein OUZ56_024660 [Daphnia magna]|uniref:Uncharacterized protein n=1 Tax=Daphnia magna TaxID=35525 RepID=A0ABR0B169_9CRUS|nr:hypothetical protein OUZ56_024660 [Daphnia magna]